MAFSKTVLLLTREEEVCDDEAMMMMMKYKDTGDLIPTTRRHS